MRYKMDDDIEQFLDLLPSYVKRELLLNHEKDKLLEVILDLNRVPEARFIDSTVDIGESPIGAHELASIANTLAFGDDNRAGLDCALHRISCIRDRRGLVVGLTCRVGRAIYGTADVISDLIKSGKSILLLGKPGIGKTTILRDAARVASTDLGKRVVIVDTSNEIAGDGPSPHRAVGRARRMQVSSSIRQADVMIEAVENHMPEVIIIDEISNGRDVSAARTIAERGVQLIATAHGYTIDSIISNPMLSDLVGGVQSVVLSDEESKRRQTAKSVLERKHFPTFDVVVEMRDMDTVAVYTDVSEAVDRYLSKMTPLPEIRKVSNGPEAVEKPEPVFEEEADSCEFETPRICLFGVTQNKVEGVLAELDIEDYEFVDSPKKANLILTVPKQLHHTKDYRGSSHIVVVGSNTKLKIKNALEEVFIEE